MKVVIRINNFLSRKILFVQETILLKFTCFLKYTIDVYLKNCFEYNIY